MKTLHIISHTHWDREWYRPFQEFRFRLVHLVDGLLDLLAADPDYRRFMLDGQTIVLEDYLELRPEREAELRGHIRSGRILIGPWHILPDEFLVSPEATIRNLLEGARTCARFGSRMRVGYIPDPFGHIGQMPQILRGFGIETAAFRRGLADEPCEVWWQAPDGSRVLASYLRDGYDNAAGLPVSDPALCAAEIVRLRDSLLPHSAADDLLLMLGTDHMEPPRGTSRAIRVANGKRTGSRVIHSSLPAYFDALEKSLGARKTRLPVVRGELRNPKRHHLLPGVLSSRMWIKQMNHECETLLEKWAEPFAAFAALEGGTPNPAPLLRSAWRMLMQNHPHDSICGCSIDEVHAEMRPRFAQARQLAEEIARASLEHLAGRVETRAGAAVVVFNPAAGPRTGRVEAEVHPPAEWDSFGLADAQGHPVPFQAAGGGSEELIHVTLDRAGVGGIVGSLHEGRAGNLALRGIQFRREGGTLKVDARMGADMEPDAAEWERATNGFREALADPSILQFEIRARTVGAACILFSARDVPGFGWQTYFLRERPPANPAPVSLPSLFRPFLPLAMRVASTPLDARLAARLGGSSGSAIENEYLRVEAAPDGTFTLVDKRTGQEYRGLNRLVDGGDCGDSYNFCPPDHDRRIGAKRIGVRVTRGVVEQALEIRLEMNLPAGLAPDRKSRAPKTVRAPITTRVTLTTGVARAEFRTTVENLADDHRLRVHFSWDPLDGRAAHVSAPAAVYDGHFELVARSGKPDSEDATWVEQWRPECPQRAFTDLSAPGRGLMIANRGLPEVEVVDGREIALTLLRCVGWLSRDDFAARRMHAGPMLPIPGAQMRGRWDFEYAVIPHAGDLRAAIGEARAYAAPFRAVETGAHAGALPVAGSFVEVQPAGFEVTAIKPGADGQGLIVRGWNTTEKPVKVIMRPWRRFNYAALVNLAEELKTPLPCSRSAEAFVTAPCKRMMTVRFWDR